MADMIDIEPWQYPIYLMVAKAHQALGAEFDDEQLIRELNGEGVVVGQSVHDNLLVQLATPSYGWQEVREDDTAWFFRPARLQIGTDGTMGVMVVPGEEPNTYVWAFYNHMQG